MLKYAISSRDYIFTGTMCMYLLTVCGSPSPRILLSTDQGRAGQVGEGRDLAIAERGVNMLSLARPRTCKQCGHDGIRRVETGCKVCDCDSDLDWRTIS